MMFGMGDRGTTNLITRALAAVGRRLESVPDPTQIHYRLPKSEAHPEVRSATAAATGTLHRYVLLLGLPCSIHWGSMRPDCDCGCEKLRVINSSADSSPSAS